MPAEWPETLPTSFFAESISEGIGEGRLVSSMDAGPAKMRRRSSAMPRPMSGTMRMTSEQWEDLREFVETDLLGGSLAFTMTCGTVEKLVRFTEMPSRTWFAAGKWAVSINLEVLP